MSKALPILLALSLLLPACLAHHTGPMPGEPRGARWAEIDGVRVRYTDVGSGPAVVLLHGFASSLETWSLLTPSLQPTRRVITLDLKGFGWTDRPQGDYSPTAQAHLVLGLLAARGVERADVVAHSWGTAVALAMALEAPDKVARLVLFDAWAYDAQLPAFFRWARYPGIGEALFALYYDERPDDRLALGFADPSMVTEALAADVERAMARPGTKAAALAAVRAQGFAEIEKRYEGIAQSTLIVWGEQDGVSLPLFARRLAHDLAASRLVWLPRCGHFPMLEAPQQVARLVTGFLAEATP